jgi:hypothetical protein
MTVLSRLPAKNRKLGHGAFPNQRPFELTKSTDDMHYQFARGGFFNNLLAAGTTWAGMIELRPPLPSSSE